MSFRKQLTCLFSAGCVALMTQVGASANPFGGINDTLDTVNDVNTTINALDQAINGTGYTVNSLSSILGLTAADLLLDDADAIRQLSYIYEVWYSGMSVTERDVLSLLVTEYGQNPSVTMDALAAADWFLALSAADQAEVAPTLYKLQSLYEATAQDGDQFLGFASCLNGGGLSCAL